MISRRHTHSAEGHPSRATALVNVVLLAALALATRGDAADSGLEWDVGRSPEIHRPDDAGVITTRVGGWSDASYQDSDLSHQSSSLNLNHLNLFVDTRYRDRLQLFLEVEFENEPDLSGFSEEREYEIEQLYASYHGSDAFNARVGQFNTPFGYWTPAHWLILMDTIQKPIHEGNRVTPEQQVGAELSGRLFPRSVLPADSEIDYAVYLGYGGGGAAFEESGADGFTWGGDLRLLLQETILLGTSVYVQRNEREADRSERSLMLYGQFELPWNLTLRGEYLRQLRDRHTRPTLSRQINIAYAKLRWSPREDVYLNYRFSAGDDDSSGTTLEEQIHTVTLGLRPWSPIRIKLEWSSHDFRDPGREDFLFWGASVGYLF